MMRNKYGHKRGQMFGDVTIIQTLVLRMKPVKQRPYVQNYCIKPRDYHVTWRIGSAYHYGALPPRYPVPALCDTPTVLCLTLGMYRLHSDVAWDTIYRDCVPDYVPVLLF